METEEIFDKVKEIIVEQLGVAENTVNLEACRKNCYCK